MCRCGSPVTRATRPQTARRQLCCIGTTVAALPRGRPHEPLNETKSSEINGSGAGKAYPRGASRSNFEGRTAGHACDACAQPAGVIQDGTNEDHERFGI
jgi:hypothetical protein